MHSGRSSKQHKHDVVLRNILVCGHCGKIITWQCQKGHLYGACQRDLPECKQNKMVREEYIQEILTNKLKALISPSPAVVKWLVARLNSEFELNTHSAETYRETIKSRINKLEIMDEMLYDDKLTGVITPDRYETKHVGFKKQIEELSDQLLVSDATIENKHSEAIDLIELTQTAYDQYLSADLTNEAKRTILTKLFNSVIFTNNSLSVNYTYLAKSIAQKCEKTKQIMEEQKILNQTNKKDLIERGQAVENFHQELLFPVWQGHVELNHDLRFWRPIY